MRPFSPEAGISILVMLVLLLFSGAISGSEIAYFSLNPLQLRELRTSTDNRDHLIIRQLERPKRLLATILISNNFVNVAIVILSTFITTEMFNLTGFPLVAFLIQVVVVTTLILIIGEIMPKILANEKSIRFARMMAYPISLLIKIFYPVSSLLVNFTSLIDKRVNRRGYNISMEELSQAIEITSDETTPEEERKILKGIVKFGDIEVKEIMKSRVDVTAVEVNTPFRELMDIIIESGYSRIPVYRDNFDNLAGILYVKDLMPYLNKGNEFDWRQLLREKHLFFVPENKRINDLLEEIQEKKIHMAIVVDEYGGTSGIVTLEDILEEIVGEITDEYDSIDEESLYSKLDENQYLFEGKTSLNDFCKILNIDGSVFERVKGDSDSLAGLILELEGKIPAKGETISFDKYKFTIEAVDKRRIKKIKVTLNEKETQE
ncbi:MAG: gliding motility-associated protein GldE [Bacteroidales bacterium]|nr:gliding motility-associated protein GldE [Bacteroidales bacterium]